MSLVVLDGYAMNPGDLSWDSLEPYGPVTVYERTPHELAAQRIGAAQMVLTNKVPITQAVMDACPNLRYIGVTATGYNIVDLTAASARDILVTNIPAYSTPSVAQHVFALLLELTNRVGWHAQSVRAGAWQSCADFCYWDRPLMELAGKTFGIIGYGRIGQAVAQRAMAFDMEVLAVSSHALLDQPHLHTVSMDELLAQSDVISLHCPLTEKNKGFFNQETIDKMKDGALLINTARGPLIHSGDLAQALRSGKVAGAAVDALPQEPPRDGDPLIDAPNCIITPHLAWASAEARRRLLDITVQNLAAFAANQPINVVN
ncbi:D-2-hydroxyacid dehydrogenase [Pseudoflavonifractor sp. 524-17]|uniref:D-2-hydroxyacid dehydrogenase n=1 Tax=Pseudoflavonifractor sp. 524-17 TaxID=2304577 RepID=UPI00137ACC69|nr:D-2-hydroxyacid dehydrogenase [Pseudoflavonifractor sp. 524-17]NCE65222.1 D-2-hydroxyacid dehydrogenase [Pseudoflavonifractor sp. 524-17]